MPILASGSNVIPMVLAVGVALVTVEAANPQDSEEHLDRATEKLDIVGPLPADRPTLVGDRLIWSDHALLGLCSEFGGTFRKLAGRAEYMCRLPMISGPVPRAKQPGSK
jgi:hypothetical protein